MKKTRHQLFIKDNQFTSTDLVVRIGDFVEFCLDKNASDDEEHLLTGQLSLSPNKTPLENQNTSSPQSSKVMKSILLFESPILTKSDGSKFSIKVLTAGELIVTCKMSHTIHCKITVVGDNAALKKSDMAHKTAKSWRSREYTPYTYSSDSDNSFDSDVDETSKCISTSPILMSQLSRSVSPALSRKDNLIDILIKSSENYNEAKGEENLGNSSSSSNSFYDSDDIFSDFEVQNLDKVFAEVKINPATMVYKIKHEQVSKSDNNDMKQFLTKITSANNENVSSNSSEDEEIYKPIHRNQTSRKKLTSSSFRSSNGKPSIENYSKPTVVRRPSSSRGNMDHRNTIIYATEFQFQPSSIVVHQNESITFSLLDNNSNIRVSMSCDDEFDDITISKERNDDSPIYTHKFCNIGTFSVVNSIFSFMSCTVQVIPNPFNKVSPMSLSTLRGSFPFAVPYTPKTVQSAPPTFKRTNNLTFDYDEDDVYSRLMQHKNIPSMNNVRRTSNIDISPVNRVESNMNKSAVHSIPIKSLSSASASASLSSSLPSSPVIRPLFGSFPISPLESTLSSKDAKVSTDELCEDEIPSEQMKTLTPNQIKNQKRRQNKKLKRQELARTVAIVPTETSNMVMTTTVVDTTITSVSSISTCTTESECMNHTDQIISNTVIDMEEEGNESKVKSAVEVKIPLFSSSSYTECSPVVPHVQDLSNVSSSSSSQSFFGSNNLAYLSPLSSPTKVNDNSKTRRLMAFLRGDSSNQQTTLTSYPSNSIDYTSRDTVTKESDKSESYSEIIKSHEDYLRKKWNKLSDLIDKGLPDRRAWDHREVPIIVVDERFLRETSALPMSHTTLPPKHRRRRKHQI